MLTEEVLAIGEKQLSSCGIVLDGYLLQNYAGQAIRVTNGVVLLLKSRFSLKQTYTIYRRLCGVVDADDYVGETFDRTNFKYAIRALHEKVQRMSIQQQAEQDKETLEDLLAKEFAFTMKYLLRTRGHDDVDDDDDDASAAAADGSATAHSTEQQLDAELKDQGDVRSSGRRRPMKRVMVSPSPVRRSKSSPKVVGGKFAPMKRGRRKGTANAAKNRHTQFHHSSANLSSSSTTNTGDVFSAPRTYRTNRSVHLSTTKKRMALMATNNKRSGKRAIAADEDLQRLEPSPSGCSTLAKTKSKRINAHASNAAAAAADDDDDDDDDDMNNNIDQTSSTVAYKLNDTGNFEESRDISAPITSSTTEKQPFSNDGDDDKDELCGKTMAKSDIMSLIRHYQKNDFIKKELERRVNEMLEKMSKLEQEKKDYEEELSLAMKRLNEAKTQIKHLYEVNAELSKQEVAIKRNGEYTDELKACLCHLKKAGVPDAKCGEVIISVGVLLGRKVVADANHDHTTNEHFNH